LFGVSIRRGCAGCVAAAAGARTIRSAREEPFLGRRVERESGSDEVIDPTLDVWARRSCRGEPEQDGVCALTSSTSCLPASTRWP